MVSRFSFLFCFLRKGRQQFVGWSRLNGKAPMKREKMLNDFRIGKGCFPQSIGFVQFVTVPIKRTLKDGHLVITPSQSEFWKRGFPAKWVPKSVQGVTLQLLVSES